MEITKKDYDKIPNNTVFYKGRIYGAFINGFANYSTTPKKDYKELLCVGKKGVVDWCFYTQRPFDKTIPNPEKEYLSWDYEKVERVGDKLSLGIVKDILDCLEIENTYRN